MLVWEDLGSWGGLMGGADVGIEVGELLFLLLEDHGRDVSLFMSWVGAWDIIAWQRHVT